MAIWDYWVWHGMAWYGNPYPSMSKTPALNRRGSFQAVAGLVMEEGEKSLTKPFTK